VLGLGLVQRHLVPAAAKLDRLCNTDRM
jgi:hypothetical protein